MIVDYLEISFKYLRFRQMRAWLTLLGVVMGIAAIVSLISLGQGLENAINEQFETLGVSNIRILPGSLNGPPAGVVGLTVDDVKTVEKVKGVDYVTPLFNQFAEVEFHGQKEFFFLTGYTPELSEKAFADIDLNIESGRNFQKGDSKVAILGSNLANDVFDDAIRVKNKITIQNENFQVIGIFEKANPQFDNSIYVPIDDVRELYNNDRDVSLMIAKAKPGQDINKVAEDIKIALKREKDNENFEVFTPVQLLDQLNSIIGVIQIVLVGIAGVSLLVGGIGIMNTMYTSVLERVREIGVMKAIGAKNSNILLLFLLESGLIGVVGGLAGIMIGYGISFAAGYAAELAGFGLLAIKLDFFLIFGSLSFAFFVGVSSGLFPAMQAAKLNPIEALRYE